MRHSIVGVFANDAAAQNAVRQLDEEAGLKRGDMEVIDGTSDVTPQGRQEGVVARIAHFFRSLIGAGDEDHYSEHERYYTEQLRQGRSVVVVNAPDE